MLEKPMDVLAQYPVRKTKKQKDAFRGAAAAYLRSLGYDPKGEKGSRGCVNLVIGDPEQAEYLVTAHYDTCPTLPVPNLITPCNFWTFLGYQLLVTALLLLPPVIPGVAVGIWANSPQLGFYVWYLLFWVVFILMFAGPANKHNANDNTSGVVALLETARSLPEDQRGRVCFVLFDLEEAGLVGSASYRRLHRKAVERQIVLNMDCVGDGDEIMLFPTKKLARDEAKMSLLEQLCCRKGEKSVTLHRKGFSVYPSDQRNFPYGLGVAAFRRNKHVGLYCGRIHTGRDTILEEENINILRDSLLKLLGVGAAEERKELEYETV